MKDTGARHPKIYVRKNDAKTIAKLKRKYLEYYRTLPIQRYARQWIGRDEDTIILWKKLDPKFSDDVQAAESEWTAENVKMVKSREFLLERIQHQEFMERKQVENGVTDELSKALDRLSQVLKPAAK
jgi:hypothetical protein